MINSLMKKYFLVFVSSALMANNANALPDIYIKGETGALLRHKPYSSTYIRNKSFLSAGIKKPIDNSLFYDVAFKIKRTHSEGIEQAYTPHICVNDSPIGFDINIEEDTKNKTIDTGYAPNDFNSLCDGRTIPAQETIKTKTDTKTTHHIPATIYKALPYDVTAGFGTDLSRITDGFHLKVKHAFGLNNQWGLNYGYTYQRLQKFDDQHIFEAKLNSKRLGLGVSATMTSGNDQLTSIYLEHEISNLTIGIKSEFKEGVQEHNSLYFAFSL